VAGCIPPGAFTLGKARIVAALRGVVEAAATAVTHVRGHVGDALRGVVEAAATAVARGRARVLATLRGVVETAVNAVAHGETRVVESGNCLFDLAVCNWCCAAVCDLRCAAADFAFPCATAAARSFS
jgi:hypothetical protein